MEVIIAWAPKIKIASPPIKSMKSTYSIKICVPKVPIVNHAATAMKLAIPNLIGLTPATTP